MDTKSYHGRRKKIFSAVTSRLSIENSFPTVDLATFVEAALMFDLFDRANHWLAKFLFSAALITALGFSAILLPRATADSGELANASLPNIVFLLCDDLGIGDLQAFNPDSKIATPHIDRLAASGMRFTDAHSGSAVCTPTRYGLLCGRYAWRTRLQNGVLGGLSPSLISNDQLTVPKLLKRKGYHSACVGKWHLGLDWERVAGKDVSENSIETLAQTRHVHYDRPFGGGPLAAGFDHYFGISASLDMVPYVYLKDQRVLASPTAEKSFGMRSADDENQTRFGPAAEDFTAEDVLPRLTREAIEYVERRTTASDKAPFFLYVPFASPHTPIAPTEDWTGRSGLNSYADFVMQQDESIGQILHALERCKLSENTIVFLASDNGCSPQADLPSLRAKGHNPCAPYRGHKADIYEGGHRVPLIVSWPGVVNAGSSADQTVCLVDLLATVADLTNSPLPAEAAGDSFSLLPVLEDPNAAAVRPSTVHHSINGSFAIRQGDYKLCFCSDSGGWSDPRPLGKVNAHATLQLFNLREDIAETKNLASEQPELVLSLTREMEAIISRGRSTPGPDLSNDVPVRLWNRAQRPKPLTASSTLELISPKPSQLFQPRPVHEATFADLPELHLLEPAWHSPIVHRESSVWLQMERGGAIQARLAFPASEILSITSANGATKYQIDRDCTLSDDRQTLTWTGGGSIQPITAEQMFPAKDAPHSYRHRASNPEQNLFYAPGKWFHEHNIEVTYRRAEFDRAASPQPTSSLARARAKLHAKLPIKIAVSGDSISTGLDASGTTSTPPNQPGYAELVAAQLAGSFNCEVALDNRSVSGWSIAQGVADLPALLAGKPDLLIVAYGMNDVGRRDPSWFAGQAKTLAEKAKAELPNVEIVWVAPMLGNKEWVHTPREMFSLYRDELAELKGPDAALADLTTVWQTLLVHKHDLDLTGNGLNHPNDFGHRLYAQCILELFPRPQQQK